MLKQLFKNRVFIVGFLVFVCFMGGCLLYLWQLEREDAAYEAETEAIARRFNEKQHPPASVETPADETREMETQTTQQQRDGGATETPNGHFHADGTFHAEPHLHESVSRQTAGVQSGASPASETSPVRTRNVTYHADLLASHPVEALRALAEELEHWSAEWIPPYPPDDERAAALARAVYHVAYDKAIGRHWQTPTFQQNSSAFSSQLAALRNMEYSTERSDLSKLTWLIGSRRYIGDPSTWRTNFELPVR